ncbi:ankyrin repeat domain-containing protein 37 [Ranitomeya variabilis]|uniref:ankyrin repeat domain-containing protein 37 n=1 Tax=Ranitomeya variabilis TaxID=490064 RepID=UPI004056F4D0
MCLLFEYVRRGGACSGIRAVACGDRAQIAGSAPTVRTERGVTVTGRRMLYQREDEELPCLSRLMECGGAVNSPGDALGQSPAHLAAHGGQASMLLWQLRTGADINQQDFFGETLIHKAARCGSLECLSVLVAHDARLDLCNKEGLTAEALALSHGFEKCARYLATVKQTQDLFSRAHSSMQDLKETTAGIKRGQCNISAAYGKRRCSDGFL